MPFENGVISVEICLLLSDAHRGKSALNMPRLGESLCFRKMVDQVTALVSSNSALIATQFHPLYRLVPSTRTTAYSATTDIANDAL